MAQSAPARTKINTKVTQPAPGRSSRRPGGPGQAARQEALAGAGTPATRSASLPAR